MERGRQPRSPFRRRGHFSLPLFLLKLDLFLLAILAVSRLLLLLIPAGPFAFQTPPEVTALSNVSPPEVTARSDVPPPEIPDWIDVALLDVNEWSRPGTPLEQVNGVVIHYVGNPNTTAAQNRSYFNGLAASHKTYASSNFIIGLDGEILLCVPMDEVAYCSNGRNNDTLSIEVCHPDDTGEFTQASYDSLVKLVRWLADCYALEREDIIRHSDIEGVYKECPRWFVVHPEAWEQFLDDLELYG